MILAAAILWSCPTESAFGVTLAWDPSPDTNVAGYIVHCGTNSGSYQIRLDVGNQTNATVQLPTSGPTHFFVVTAHTVDGVESLPSNEVSYMIPDAVSVIPGDLSVAASSAQGLGIVSFQGLAGETVAVQTSEDLVQWKTLYQLQPAASQICQIVDPDSTRRPKRFYRLMGNNVATRKLQFSRLTTSAPLPKLSLMGSAGQVATVQVSDDRIHWTTLYQVQVTTNQPISFVDSAATALPMRFYRLVSQGVPSTEVTYLAPDALRCRRVTGQRLAVLRFPAQAGETVSVQTSEDLGNWTTLYELHPLTNQVAEIVDPGSGVLSRRFYRLLGTNVASRKLQFAWLSAATVAKLSFVAPPGDVVKVQASEDLLHWTTLNQFKIPDHQWTEFVDPASASLTQRFYRLAPGN